MEVAIGFTGTRHAMTEAQRQQVHNLISLHHPCEFHHGDCIGADAQAHHIARFYGCRIVVHPPTDPKLRAFCDGIILPEKPYIERNHDIIDAAGFVIATPFEFTEQQRSGTWATIRYARKQQKPLAVVYPNGKCARTPIDPG